MVRQKSPTITWRKMFLTLVLVFLALLILGFLFLPKPTLAIEKPTGKHAVGFSSLVVVNDSFSNTSPRALALDIWYPAETTQGFAAVPYTEQALNVQLSKHQGIPLWLNSEVPSYSFLDATPLANKHPVVIFSHGFASFSKQNFSNFQELASHGYLVISVARAGESLIAKDAQGNTVVLDTQLASYQAATALQKDTKGLAETLAAIYTKQRKATTQEAHQQASLELAQTPYFAPMQALIEAWIKDTEFIITTLGTSRGDVLQFADTAHITVMGHSLGGAVALELAKNPPPGVTGIINLDGPHLHFDATDTRTIQVPVLHFLSTQHKLAKQDIGLYGTMQMPSKENVNGVHIIEIAGTAHNNFTDLNFIPVLKYFTPLLGDVDNAKLARYVNGAILEFIQRTSTSDREGFERPLLPEEQGVKQEFVANHD
jgi:pimeloyl-ACP methyl ester carboxylesterase